MALYTMSTDEVTAKLLHMNWQGLVIPPTWLHTFKKADGGVSHDICLVLAYIVDIVKAVPLIDYKNGHYGARKKYAGNNPKINIGTISTTLGISKVQVENSIKYLELHNVIVCKNKKGTTLELEINADLLIQITFGSNISFEYSDANDKIKRVIEEEQITGSPWNVYSFINKINYIPKSASLSHAKELLKRHTEEDIKLCATYLQTDPWFTQSLVPITVSAVATRIDPWIKANRPTQHYKHTDLNRPSVESILDEL